MTTRTQTRSDRSETHSYPTVTVLAVALAALALLGAGASIAAAQPGEPAVSVTDAELATSDTATVDVVLTSAPNGLAGYNLELSVDDPDVARIEAASYPDRFDLTTDPAIDEAGETVSLEAADMGSTIDAGATDVTLATVEIAGDAPGEVELSVEPRQVDANDGDRIQPAARAGTLIVTDDSSATTTAGSESSAAGSESSSAGSDPSSSAGPITELAGSADTLSVGTLGLLTALAVIAALSALAAARRRS